MSRLAELEAGAIFASDYRIVRRLSEGGMGVIYVAEQLSTGRQRALKLMHPGLVGSPELRQKFTLEARVGARISSEHIVEVVGAGVDGDVPWLAMELLKGEDLSSVVARRGPLPKEEVVRILGQVCHGLAAAHAAGIVHRDLKPENVFLAEARRANEAYTVKLLDFGIAKVVEAARGTNTGAIGSPLWMAPEQSERNAEIGPRTDIWALGLVAFTLLTGRIFWRSGEDPDVGVTAFLRELVIEALPAASERAAEMGVGGLIPPRFDDWFGRCVVRGPDHRFPDVQTAFSALSQCLGVWPTGPQQQHVVPSSSGPLGAPSAPGNTGPLPHASTAFATARTQVDDVVASGAGPSPPRVNEPVEEAAAIVPVEGPSHTALIAGGIALFVVLAGIGLSLLRHHEATRGTEADASVAAPALFCPHGMQRIPTTTFKMGSSSGASDEAPEHTVTVAAFCMDETEVPVSDYAACVQAKACVPLGKGVQWAGIKKEEREAFNPFCNHARNDRRQHPVNCVIYEEASAYCKWAGKHLPTEEQWELAARGTDGRPFPWGGASPTEKLLNGCDDGCANVAKHGIELIGPHLTGNDNWEGTSPVGVFPEGVSPFGMFDMAGNVNEWVDASYCPYGKPCDSPAKEAAQGTHSTSKVTRGGGWMNDTPTAMHTTARVKTSAEARLPDVGFRCAK